MMQCELCLREEDERAIQYQDGFFLCRNCYGLHDDDELKERMWSRFEEIKKKKYLDRLPIKQSEQHLLSFFNCPKCGFKNRTFTQVHTNCEVCEYPILKVQWEKMESRHD